MCRGIEVTQVASWESVRNWMHKKTIVPDDHTVRRAAEVMVERDIGSVIVAHNNREVGMLTERDILKKVVARGLDVNRVMIKDVMSKPLITIRDDVTIWDGANLMAKHHIRRLPIADQRGEIIGIVTTRTISDALPVISRMKESSELKTKLRGMRHKE